MLKPKFAPPQTRYHGGPLGRQQNESFEQYRLRRSIANQEVRAINAQAPGRSHQFSGEQLRKSQGPRADRPGKGGDYGRNLMRHFDEARYTDWLPRYLNRKSKAPKMDMDWSRSVRRTP